MDRSAPDPFRGALAVVRCVALAVGLTLATRDVPVPAATLLWLGALAVQTAVLAWHSPRPGDGLRRRAGHLALDAALAVGAVAGTGGWDSPLRPSLLVPVIVAGLAWGSGVAVPVALATVALTGAAATGGLDASALEWAGVSVLVGVVAGFGRMLASESARRSSLAEDRVRQLSEANELLAALHRVSRTLPSSLDLDDVLDAAVARVGELLDHRGLSVLLVDETDGSLSVARAQHDLGAEPRFPHQLPAPLRRALRSPGAVAEPALDPAVPAFAGLTPGTRCGVYAPLRARGVLVGVLALEHDEPGRLGEREAALLDGLTDAMALAVDNARWFGRLRSLAAEEERSRIARELHDRVGQSLAFLGFELDRLVKRSRAEGDLAEELRQLRAEVRAVTSEVREALYDLRTNVTDERGLADTLRGLCARVETRSGLQVILEATETGRLPLRQERELFRIASEAITNAERHARAERLVVRWECDGRRARLEVTDDGIGLQSGSGRADAYGVVGMRERAAGLGARLELGSRAGGGTALRCLLDPDGTHELREMA